MSYAIKRTSQFKKDVKLMLKQGKELQKLLDVVDLLQNDEALPESLHDHARYQVTGWDKGMSH